MFQIVLLRIATIAQKNSESALNLLGARARSCIAARMIKVGTSLPALGNDRRLERSETAVCDRAARRALKVEGGDADLRCGNRLDGFEGEQEHFGVGGGSGSLVRDADENRAVRVDAVAEASRLFGAEVASGPNRHGFEDSRIETQLHRRSADLLARGYAQGHVEARARPRARRPLPAQLRRRGLAGYRVVSGSSRSGRRDQLCRRRRRRKGLDGAGRSRLKRPAGGELPFLECAELQGLTRA